MNMNKYHYSHCNEDLRNHISATKKFMNEISRNLTKVVFKRKGKLIQTTNRSSNYKTQTVQLRSNANLNNYEETIYGVRYAVRKNRVELQTYRFTKYIVDINNPKEEIYVELVNLVKLEKDKEPVITKTAQLSNLGWQALVIAENQDINKVFKNNYLKYVSKYITEIDTYKVKRTEDMLVRIHKYQDIIEVLDNMNNYGLIRSLRAGNIDMRVLTPNYLKKHKKWLRRGLDIRQISEIEYVSKFYKLNEINVEKISNNTITKQKIMEILEYEESNGIKSRKLLRYLDKQDKSILYYQDYIRMMNELGLDTSHWTKQFPKDLRIAHDITLEKINEQERLEKELRDKKRYEEYKSKLKEIKKLENIDQHKDYSILVPKDLSEIVEEGQELSHCVSGRHYVNKHAKEHLIMFVRRSDDLNKPHFTLQLNRKGRIVQLHGYGNEGKSDKGQEAKKELPEVKEFVEAIVKDRGFQTKYKQIVDKYFY